MKTKMTLLFLIVFTSAMFFSCSKDDSDDSDDNISYSGTVTDVDGNVYNTITIGTQIWMAENLKTTHYNDGSEITNVTDATEWEELTTAAYCIYNNDESYISNNDYGLLYNFYAANSDNIAPKGWHVPSWEEWELLLNYIDADNDIKYIASTSIDLTSKTWSSETGANSTGFSALPSGYRDEEGSFYLIGSWTNWWSTTSNRDDIGNYLSLGASGNQMGYGNHYKQMGNSIRCVKDSD